MDHIWPFKKVFDCIWPFWLFLTALTVFNCFDCFGQIFKTVFTVFLICFWPFIKTFFFYRLWLFYRKFTLMDDRRSTESKESIHSWMMNDWWWKKVQKVQNVQKVQKVQKVFVDGWWLKVTWNVYETFLSDIWQDILTRHIDGLSKLYWPVMTFNMVDDFNGMVLWQLWLSLVVRIIHFLVFVDTTVQWTTVIAITPG